MCCSWSAGSSSGLGRHALLVVGEVTLAPAAQFAVKAMERAVDAQQEAGLVAVRFLEVLAVDREHDPSGDLRCASKRPGLRARELRRAGVARRAHGLEEFADGLRDGGARRRRGRWTRPLRRRELARGGEALDVREVAAAGRAEDARPGRTSAVGADARLVIHAAMLARAGWQRCGNAPYRLSRTVCSCGRERWDEQRGERSLVDRGGCARLVGAAAGAWAGWRVMPEERAVAVSLAVAGFGLGGLVAMLGLGFRALLMRAIRAVRRSREAAVSPALAAQDARPDGSASPPARARDAEPEPAGREPEPAAVPQPEPVPEPMPEPSPSRCRSPSQPEPGAPARAGAGAPARAGAGASGGRRTPAGTPIRSSPAAGATGTARPGRRTSGATACRTPARLAPVTFTQLSRLPPLGAARVRSARFAVWCAACGPSLSPSW